MNMTITAVSNCVLIFFLSMIFCYPHPSKAWFDRTHQAVMEAAQAPYSSCLAVAADMLSSKHPVEAHNHFSDANQRYITAKEVLTQLNYYDQWDPQGHLYGAVIAAFFKLRTTLKAHKRPDYDYGFLAHYAGDLSQPLHNSVYDMFNHQHHLLCDGAVDALPNLVAQIRAHMTYLDIQTDSEALEAIVRVANQARAADRLLRQQGLSQEQILELLGQSATLLHALAAYAMTA